MAAAIFMGANEVARLVGVSRWTVTRWSWRGTEGFPGPALTEPHPRWRRSDVRAWLRSKGVCVERAEREAAGRTGGVRQL